MMMVPENVHQWTSEKKQAWRSAWPRSCVKIGIAS